MSLENQNNLTQLLTSLRKCGFSLVIPKLANPNEIYEWAVKASALAHGYTWNGMNSGDDDISKLVNLAIASGRMEFDAELDVSDEARVVLAYSVELVQHAVYMTNEQVKIGTLNRAEIL